MSIFRYPEKTAPGKYDVLINGSDEATRVRFKTERDAMRFFWAAERGIWVPPDLSTPTDGEKR